MKNFVAKHKLWFIIGGIIFAIVGAVMAYLFSSYFLIAVAVGLIVAVVSGLVKKPHGHYEAIKQINTQIRVYDEKVNIAMEKTNEFNQKIGRLNTIKTVDEYKKAAKGIITTDYIDNSSRRGFGAVNEKIQNDSCYILFEDCSNLSVGGRGDGFFLGLFIKLYFRYINLNTISSNYEVAIRGNVEALFEVFTGQEYETADPKGNGVILSESALATAMALILCTRNIVKK